MLTLDERRVRHIAKINLKPNVCEWWCLWRFGSDTIPAYLSDYALAARLSVNRRTLTYHLRAARLLMDTLIAEAAQEERKKPLLVYVGEGDATSGLWEFSIKEGHKVRRVTDKTGRKACSGK